MDTETADRILALVEDGRETEARVTYGDAAVDELLEEHAFAMLVAFGAVPNPASARP